MKHHFIIFIFKSIDIKFVVISTFIVIGDQTLHFQNKHSIPETLFYSQSRKYDSVFYCVVRARDLYLRIYSIY